MPERGASDEHAHRAYLSLGSNIDPEKNLPAAVDLLKNWGRVLAVSRVWESPPAGFTEQANFLNAAVLLATDRSAEAICIDVIPEIERRLNRTRDPQNKNAPRTIDVDLSLFDRDVRTICGHAIPAPEMLTRAFVAVPLAEIEPGYVHPTVGRTLAEIASELSDASPEMRVRTDVTLK